MRMLALTRQQSAPLKSPALADAQPGFFSPPRFPVLRELDLLAETP